MRGIKLIWVLITLLSLLFLSCGQADIGGRAQLELRLPVFSSSDVLNVYALSQDLRGGGKLSCAQLKDETYNFGSGKVEILGQASAKASDLERGEVTLTLDELPAGSNRLFAAEVIDPLAGSRRGFGCTPNVTIEAGQKISVALTVDEI